MTTDCEPGLVCVQQKNGSSTCTNNLSNVQSLPAIPDSGPTASDDASDDGPGILIPDDTGAPSSGDTGSPATSDASHD